MTIQELSLRLPNRPGELARVLRHLAEERINLAAISVDSSEREGHVRLVVSDPPRAARRLRAARYAVDARDLLTLALEDRPGSLLAALAALGKGRVNILSIAILVAREGSRVLVAVGVNDLAKAERLLARGHPATGESLHRLTNADLLAVPSAIPSESVGLLL